MKRFNINEYDQIQESKDGWLVLHADTAPYIDIVRRLVEWEDAPRNNVNTLEDAIKMVDERSAIIADARKLLEAEHG